MLINISFYYKVKLIVKSFCLNNLALTINYTLKKTVKKSNLLVLMGKKSIFIVKTSDS